MGECLSFLLLVVWDLELNLYSGSRSLETFFLEINGFYEVFPLVENQSPNANVVEKLTA